MAAAEVAVAAAVAAAAAAAAAVSAAAAEPGNALYFIESTQTQAPVSPPTTTPAAPGVAALILRTKAKATRLQRQEPREDAIDGPLPALVLLATPLQLPLNPLFATTLDEEYQTTVSGDASQSFRKPNTKTV